MNSFVSHAIKDLEAEENKMWKIKVRVSKMWLAEDFERSAGTSLNMILVDRMDNKIHAWIGEELISHFQTTFNEKEVFLIQNFTVHHYPPNWQEICFGHKKFLKLHNFTLVTKDEGRNYDIADDSFDFQKLDRIHRFEERHLIDVVGFVTSIKPLYRKKNSLNEEKSVVKFHITDKKYWHPVEFFEDLAISFIKTITEDIEEIPIIVIARIKVEMRTGRPLLSSVSATRFYVNPMEEAVVRLRYS